MHTKSAVRWVCQFAIFLLLLTTFELPVLALTPEEIRRQAEQAELTRLRAKERAETEARQGEARSAEQREQSSALPGEFGKPGAPQGTSHPAATQPSGAPATLPPPPPGTVGADPIPAAGTFQPLPYDQALPPLPDRVVRIAVLGAPSQRGASERIGTMLATGGQDGLEKSLGVAVRILFLSQTEGRASRLTRVRYRDKYLKAALRVARSIPQSQKVEPMKEEEADRYGVDVLVYVGLDLPNP